MIKFSQTEPFFVFLAIHDIYIYDMYSTTTNRISRTKRIPCEDV